MTNNHMKIFVEVYKTLNMTRAAENLNMTQPAVTRAIKEIEGFYGIRLFERYNRGLHPTEKAKEVYFHAKSIMNSFNIMEKVLTDTDKVGTLRIGSTIALGIYLLPKLVKHIQEERPNLEVRVCVENGSIIERKLISNELDIAFIEGPVHDRNLVAKPILDERLVLIASPDSDVRQSITLDELFVSPLLCRESGSVTRNYLESMFLLHERILEPVWESESSHAIINAVHENLGMSLLPEKLVQSPLKVGWIKEVTIKDVSLYRTDNIVIHKDKYRSDIIQSMLDADYKDDYLEGYNN